jgi:hypothetical protein
MQTPKSRGGGGTPSAARGFFELRDPKNSDFDNQPQAPVADGEPVDRRSADWAVRAMTAALRALTGTRYLQEFRLYSEQDRQIEAVRELLRAAILRRRKNLRRIVTGRQS